MGVLRIGLVAAALAASAIAAPTTTKKAPVPKPTKAKTTLSWDKPTSAAVTWATGIPTTASPSLPIETKQASPPSTLKYFITFGDSYSQTGFNITTGPAPSPSSPFGNPAYPGYTTSGGANWIGNLVQNDNATLILNYNFAYGGATTDAGLVTPYEPTVLSLIDQVDEFVGSIGKVGGGWTSADTLFGIWIGVNDVGNTWYKSDVNATVDKIMGRIGEQAERIYAAGGRNFVVLGVPPIQRTPTQLSSCDAYCLSTQPAVIEYYNTALQSTITTLTTSHPDTKIAYVDTVSVFNTILDNPTQYGAQNASCYAADGTSCLWWNDYHPGLAIQKAVAEAAARGVGEKIGAGWFSA